MKKKVFGRQFKRDANERKALFKGLMTSLVLYEQIKTTREKAKAIQPSIEKLVTKAKKANGNAKRLVAPYLSPIALEKFLTQVAPRFAKRPGGYTRIIRIGNRVKDNASVVLMEWTEKKPEEVSRKVSKGEKVREGKIAKPRAKRVKKESTKK